MTPEDRRELAELYAADDRLRQEHEQWFVQRGAEREALVREKGPDGFLYREHENNALVPGTAADSEPSEGELTETDKKNLAGWNAWMRGHLDIERQAIREELEGALVTIIVELRKEWYDEVKTALAKRDAEMPTCGDRWKCSPACMLARTPMSSTYRKT